MCPCFAGHDTSLLASAGIRPVETVQLPLPAVQKSVIPQLTVPQSPSAQRTAIHHPSLQQPTAQEQTQEQSSLTQPNSVQSSHRIRMLLNDDTAVTHNMIVEPAQMRLVNNTDNEAVQAANAANWVTFNTLDDT